jgi:hypothetical protein
MRAVNNIQLSSTGVVSERELLNALPTSLARSGSDVSMLVEHTVRLLEGLHVHMQCVTFT